MREEVVNYAYPIFRYTFGALEQIRRGNPPARGVAAAELTRLLSGFYHPKKDEDAYSERQLIHAAMVYWVDDVFTGAVGQWGDDWVNHSLEKAYWNSSDRAVKFYSLATEAVRLPNMTDAVEVFMLCVRLGFRGERQDLDARRRWLVEDMAPHVLPFAEESGSLDGCLPSAEVHSLPAPERSGFQGMLVTGVVLAVGWLALSVVVLVNQWMR